MKKKHIFIPLFGGIAIFLYLTCSPVQQFPFSPVGSSEKGPNILTLNVESPQATQEIEAVITYSKRPQSEESLNTEIQTSGSSSISSNTDSLLSVEPQAVSVPASVPVERIRGGYPNTIPWDLLETDSFENPVEKNSSENPDSRPVLSI